MEAALNDIDELMQQEDSTVNESAVTESVNKSVNESVNESVNTSSSSVNECPECGKAFKSKQSLKVHVDVQHRGITHDCRICPKVFKYAHHLKLHVKKKHFATEEFGQEEKGAEQGNICDI